MYHVIRKKYFTCSFFLNSLSKKVVPELFAISGVPDVCIAADIFFLLRSTYRICPLHLFPGRFLSFRSLSLQTWRLAPVRIPQQALTTLLPQFSIRTAVTILQGDAPRPLAQACSHGPGWGANNAGMVIDRESSCNLFLLLTKDLCVYVNSMKTKSVCVWNLAC